MSRCTTIGLAFVALTLAACGEKPQTASTTKKTDGKGYEIASSTSLADGWKGGDRAAWEAQLRARAQRGQDEYPRSQAPAAAAAPAAPAVAAAASAAPTPKAP